MRLSIRWKSHFGDWDGRGVRRVGLDGRSGDAQFVEGPLDDRAHRPRRAMP
jgi:hypothetical protein